MSSLEHKAIDALKAQLLEMRAAARSEIGAYLHGSDASGTLALRNDNLAIDDAAQADVLNDSDIAHLNYEAAVLRDVDGALARIDAGTFGACTGCGEAIAPARLQAMPAAAHCLACEQEFERTHAGIRHVSM